MINKPEVASLTSFARNDATRYVIARSERQRATKQTTIVTLLLATLFIAGCATKTTAVKAPTKLTVKAVKVDKAPKLDGQGDDAVWRQAPAATIRTKGGPELTLKTVYTADSIYFLATWKDWTPQNGLLYWEYDGEKWHSNLNEDDKISFIWNIDRSVDGFDKTGCAAICHKGPEGRDEMAVFAPAKQGGKIWPAYKDKADAWKWAPGVMTEKHVVDDGLFSAGREALAHPEMQTRFELSMLFDGGDQGTKQWWTRNPNAAGGMHGEEEEEEEENEVPGSFKPAFMPKPGYDLSKHPFPNARDMVPITDYSIFKAGDRVPLVMYFDLTTSKNKMDFPAGRPSGSRVDLNGEAVYKNGHYTLEFGRKLNTAHNDDVQFRPQSGQAVAENVFGVALFNDTRYGHTVSDPVTLILEP